MICSKKKIGFHQNEPIYSFRTQSTAGLSLQKKNSQKVKAQGKIESLANNEISTKYFFLESKECQTPDLLESPNKNEKISESMLVSHRDSIEKQIVSIFKDKKLKKHEKKIRPNTQGTDSKKRNLSFQCLIKNAREFRPSSPKIESINAINGSKLIITKKIIRLPCNKAYERSLKKEISINLLGPRKIKKKMRDKASFYNEKNMKLDIKSKVNKTFQRNFRSVTPTIMKDIKFEMLNTSDSKMRSIIPSPTSI